MPKVNFNTPFVDINGEPVKEAKVDTTKARKGDKGGIEHDLKVDENGEVVYEVLNFKSILSNTLLSPYPGDENVPYCDRVKRGKLAKKIVSSSTANYRQEEIDMLRELVAKSKSTLVLLQFDELLEKEGAEDAIKDTVTQAESPGQTEAA